MRTMKVLGPESNTRQGTDMTVGHITGIIHLVIRNIWKHRWKFLAVKLLEIKAKNFTYGDKN